MKIRVVGRRPVLNLEEEMDCVTWDMMVGNGGKIMKQMQNPLQYSPREFCVLCNTLSLYFCFVPYSITNY